MNWDQYQSTPKLLPPTVFEKTHETNPGNGEAARSSSSVPVAHSLLNSSSLSQNDSYFIGENQFNQLLGELDKLKFEIKKLHSENEILRHKNRDFVEQTQLYTEVSEHRKISISALEEVIHKQTKEIQQLKYDLLAEKEANLVKLNELEKKSDERVNELSVKLTNASSEHQRMCADYEAALDKLKRENETLKSERSADVARLTQQNELQMQSYDRQIDELQSRFNDLKRDKERYVEESELKLKSIVAENQKLTAELNQLRTYVNDSMPTIQTVRDMTTEREKYEEQILKIKAKNDLLVKENNALQIRFKSISEILNIQEAQLESKLVAASPKYQGLLNKWRTKVFELLVQAKSLDISHSEEKSREQRLLNDAIERLETETSRNKILENQIEDKKAEITVLTSDNTVLNEQLSLLKEDNQNLQKRQQQDLQSSIELKNFVQLILKEYQKIEDSFRTANKKLTHLDQRVEFAKNRLNVIKALYSNNEKRRPDMNMTSSLSSIHGLDNQPESSVENNEILRDELEKVSGERDLLANRLQVDMQQMNEKLTKMKDEYELVISTLNNELRELRETNQAKQEQIDQAGEQLLSKSKLYDELNRKYDELEKQFNELRAQLNVDFEKKVKEKELSFSDKMSKMDEKLNEARREQAKAVVLMRQMERSTNREKERLESLLKSCDSYYKDHVSRLQAKLISLQKENNLLTGNKQLAKIRSSDLDGLVGDINWYDERKTTTTFDEAAKQNPDVKSSSKPNEITSFWLDSKQSNIDEDNDQNEEGQSVNQNEHSQASASDLDKNVEILQQIRRIMGNLELSDNDDNEDEDEEEVNSNIVTKNQTDEEIASHLSDNEAYNYETEHAIDDIFNRKENSLKN